MCLVTIGYYRSLEVIWRSFGGPKLKFDLHYRLSIQKNLSQCEIWQVMFSGHYWSLEVMWRSFGGHLFAPNSILISPIDLASQKTYKKTYYMPYGRFDLRFMFSGHYRSLEVIWRSFRGHLVAETQF